MSAEYPEATWRPSPNFNQRPVQPPNMIVLHATVIGLNATLSGFERTTSGVSSHYVVGKDGGVFQMVKEQDRAWHAGESFWKGRHDINNSSIGIEMVNRNDGVDPWPDEQVNAVLELCRYLVKKYVIMRDNVVTHEWIAGYAGRGKTDPVGFPMSSFLDRLFDPSTSSGQGIGEGFDFHYVLLGQTMDGIVPWAWIDALRAYLERFRVTLGFSHDHAMMTSPKTRSRHITIIGSPDAKVPVSEEVENILRASGATVERVPGTSAADIQQEMDHRAAIGQRYG
ncbi:MAG: N-acetylmuramoyl-L-alanine amidase [Anaerolineae bacterium]